MLEQMTQSVPEDGEGVAVTQIMVFLKIQSFRIGF